ncbi:MAG: TIGR03435 family protein [Candidatus Korobacteraceae bacterium]
MKTRISIGLIFAVGLLLAASAILGQTALRNPAFEVATVKPSPPPDMAKMTEQIRAGKMPRFGPHVNASQAEFTYMSLKELIATAYTVKEYQISGPAWLATDRFDIVAKLPDGASKDDAPKMLQALLAERFKLVTHRDTQEHPVLVLLVGKDGPKLKESTATAEPIDENAPPKPGETQMDGPNEPIRMTRNDDGSETMNMGAKGTMTVRVDGQAQTMHLESSMVTMAGFADMLTMHTHIAGGGGRQVVDMTGLKGNYQVALDISLAEVTAMAQAAHRGAGISSPMPPAGGGGENNSPASAASEPIGGSSVFASVQKLGLKLEKRKAPVEQIVIDHVEKIPAED